VSTRVPVWNIILPVVYVAQVDQESVTDMFVPVAVPLLERVVTCRISSFGSSFVPPFTSTSDAVDISIGALMVTGTFGVHPRAHSVLP
jgi:hypothetical protein